MNITDLISIQSGGPGSGPTAPCPQCGPGGGADKLGYVPDRLASPGMYPSSQRIPGQNPFPHHGSPNRRMYDTLRDGQFHTWAELQSVHQPQSPTLYHTLRWIQRVGEEQHLYHLDINKFGYTAGRGRMGVGAKMRPWNAAATPRLDTSDITRQLDRLREAAPPFPPTPGSPQDHPTDQEMRPVSAPPTPRDFTDLRPVSDKPISVTAIPPPNPVIINGVFRQPYDFLAKPVTSLTDDQAKTISSYLRENKILIPPELIQGFEKDFRMSPEDYKVAVLKGVPKEISDNTTVSITQGGRGAWNVEMRNRNSFEQDRNFNFEDRSVYHSSWTIHSAEQGKGLAKTIFANQLDMYDHLGMKKISVGANSSVGGYAWARFGFVPSQSSWDSLRGKSWDGELKSQVMSITDPAVRARAKLILDISDPKALWLVAAMNDQVPDPRNYGKTIPLGKKLLLGTSWNGSIDLTNPENYGVLKSYVSSKKEKTMTAEAEPPDAENLLKSEDGQTESDWAAFFFAVENGFNDRDAVKYFVSSPSVKNTVLGDIKAGAAKPIPLQKPKDTFRRLNHQVSRKRHNKV